jgi:D-serine deaminase-like pyridoxal phosphate-dependent protein
MEIIRPTLILNKQKCLQNIEVMAEKAKRHKLQFRPHFKTHQSIEIGRWFRDFDVKQITVSSVKMADYFAGDGWDDITIAFPFNTRETNELNKLAETVSVNIVADNTETINLLEDKLNKPVGIFVKITTGYDRVGIPSFSVSKIEELISRITNNKLLTFKGFITHAGHTYNALSKNEVQSIHFDSVLKMNNLKQHFIKKYPNLMLSIGDTPGCSVSESFNGIDEIRPGNFVFYDLKQHSLGACNIDNIAVRMHCPIVSKQRVRNEIAIYGGAIHFSLDHIQNTDGKPLFGRVIIKQNGEPKLLSSNYYLTRMSQEHGMIRISPNFFNKIKIGDVAEILPVHSCLTAQAMGGYITTKGERITMMEAF